MKRLMIVSLLGLGITTSGYAEEYVSVQNPDGSYTTMNSQPAPAPESGHHHKHKNKLKVSIGVPVGNTTYYIGSKPKKPFYWVDSEMGRPLPNNVVHGGYERHPNLSLFVCRAAYNGGMHPGKLYRGNCDISWGGREIPISHYQVLVSNVPVNWVPANHGYVPNNAIPGGNENGRPLYICQVKYRNGWHNGKLVGQNCNVGWGGAEVAIPYYKVLVA